MLEMPPTRCNPALWRVSLNASEQRLRLMRFRQCSGPQRIGERGDGAVSLVLFKELGIDSLVGTAVVDLDFRTFGIPLSEHQSTKSSFRSKASRIIGGSNM